MLATVDVRLIPPLSFFRNVRFGGSLFSLISVQEGIKIFNHFDIRTKGKYTTLILDTNQKSHTSILDIKYLRKSAEESSMNNFKENLTTA